MLSCRLKMVGELSGICVKLQLQIDSLLYYTTPAAPRIHLIIFRSSFAGST